MTPTIDDIKNMMKNERKIMSEKLKPCPFCGNDNIDIIQYCKNGIRIFCLKCHAKFEGKVRKFSLEWIKNQLIKQWNTRTP